MARELPVITTERLVLRSARSDDVEDIRRNIGDWDVIRMLAMPPWPYTRADAEVFVQRASGYMITLDGEVIGGIGVGERHGRDFFGYWIGRRFWRCGFAFEAATALIADFFQQPTHDELYSGYLVENTASHALQGKLGFQKIGDVEDYVVSRRAKLPAIKTRLTRRTFEDKFAVARA